MHPSAPASATLPQRRGLIQALGRSRERFSAQSICVIGNLQPDSPAMCCASYARTAPDSKLSLRPQHRPHACCASALASFIASPGHRLRAGQSAGPPLWTWLVRKEPSSALHSAQGRGEQLAGSGLTIRSSRDRFAASAWRRRLCHRRGRKSVRLNSGVSPYKGCIQKGSPFAAAVTPSFLAAQHEPQ